MNLAHEQLGDASSGMSIAFVHGFTQTRRSMLGLINELLASSARFNAISVDAPFHGESQHVATDVSGAADALVDTCGSAIYVGYSMGARICLHAAVQHPNAVQGLVLLSGTAGIIDPAQRQHRRDADNELADHVEQIGTPQFIQEWLAKPMFALLPEDQQDIAQRCTNSAASLASSLRKCGTGTQQSLWENCPHSQCLSCSSQVRTTKHFVNMLAECTNLLAKPPRFTSSRMQGTAFISSNPPKRPRFCRTGSQPSRARDLTTTTTQLPFVFFR